MKKKKEKISKYIDIEASESESSGYSSEDIGPSEGFDIEPVKSTVEEESEEGAEEEVVEEVSQHNLLPNKFSPKIWLVRVKSGKEKSVLHKLVNKTQPISVICKEGLSGYIYIESFTKQKVVEALEDMHGVNKSRITLIPVQEMIDIFSETFPDLEENKFARIRSGKYKSDLAQVLEVANTELVRVRLIPRINNVKELFDHNKYRCAKSKGYYIYKKDCYKDGFLEKEMLAKNLVPTVDLSFEEMEMFKVLRPVLRISDKVRIVKGDLKNMVGIVKNINEESVTLKTDVGECMINSDSLVKYFDIGDEVSYKHQNGIVVSMEKSECVILIDFDKEIKVGIEELTPPVFGGQYKVNLNRRPRIKRDALLNKEVEIKVGTYKGYKGIVKDVYGDSCRVQLNTNMKDVNVIREDLAIEESPGFVFKLEKPDYQTPSYKTPSYKTPGYKTPGYKTPGYKTPAYKTPAYITPGYKTPAYKTPTYNSGYNKPKMLDISHSKFDGASIMVGRNMCFLKDVQNNKYITEMGVFDRIDVEYISPAKYDKVCILEGEDVGKSGILVAVNNNVSVIRSSDGSIVSVPFNTITKIV